MPDLDVVDLDEPALLWRATGTTRQAEPIIGPVCQIDVRWVNRKSISYDPEGNTIGVDATIAACVDIPIHSIMWEGALDDVSGTAYPPVPTSGLMEVVTGNRAKDLRARSTRREYGLKRFNDTLPTVV